MAKRVCKNDGSNSGMLQLPAQYMKAAQSESEDEADLTDLSPCSQSVLLKTGYNEQSIKEFFS